MNNENGTTIFRCPLSIVRLFVLFVQRMAAAAATELFELKPVRRVLFVLCRHVIPLFALGALQNYVISRHFELPYSKFHIPNSRLFRDLESGIWNQ
jgi:hypothetical protein